MARMLFSAGLGVGIVFWGVAEPLTHYLHSPFPKDVPNQSAESKTCSHGLYLLSLGISQWSIFAMAGLIVAYFQFRKKRDGLISTKNGTCLWSSLQTSISKCD